MKPLIYLEVRALINSIKRSARTPKRLIPILLMAAWVFSSFANGLIILASARGSRGPDLDVIGRIPIEMIEAGLFLFLSAGCAMTMYGAFKSGLMIFTLAHIDFLFPTPISRRHVLIVKLFKDYFKYGFFVAFFYLFFGSMAFGALDVQMMPWGFVGIIALASLLVLVVNLAHTINLVFTFAWERLSMLGLAIKAALVIIPITALVYGLNQYAQSRSGYLSVIWAARSPVMNAVFAPAKWCSTLVLAPLLHVTYPEGWLQFGALVGLALASIVVLLSRKENIYEPALGITIKVARTRAAARSGDYASIRLEALRDKGLRRMKGTAFPAFGRGATAFVWKNLLVRLRTSRSLIFLGAFMAVVMIYSMRVLAPDKKSLEWMPIMFFYVAMGMSMAAQMDMRTELRHANIVKSMPVAAWKITLAQVASSVGFITIAVWLLGACLWLLAPAVRGPVFFACAAAMPFIAFAIAPAGMIPAIMYPDVRDMLQNYLAGLLSLAFVGMALAPSAALGVTYYYVVRRDPCQAIAVASAAGLVMGAAGVCLAGRAFKAFDPTGD